MNKFFHFLTAVAVLAGVVPSVQAQFSPRDMSGLILWLDGDDPASMDIDGDNRVSIWRDKGDEGLEALRAEIEEQPVYVENRLNGRGVVRFNGSSSMILGTAEVLNLDPQTDYTFFAVVNSRNNGSILAKTDGNAMQYRFHIPGSRALRVEIGGAFSDTDSVTGPDHFSLVGTVNNQKDGVQGYDLYFDGVLENRGTAGTTMVPSNTTLGGRNDDGRTQRLDFDLAELIIVNRAVTDAERIQLEEYLSAKFALDTASSPFRVESLLPEFGAIGADPAAGIELRVAANVAGYEIEQAALLLNGEDRTGSVTVTRDGDVWRVRFDDLEEGVEYSGYFHLTMANGSHLRVDVRFDTVQLVFDPEFAPGDLSGLMLWMDGNDPSSMILDDAGRVSVWTDKSLLGHEAGRAQLDQQPVFMPGIANGRGVVRFSGAQSLLLGQPPALDFEGSDDFTFFAVVNSRAAGSLLAKTVGNTMQYRFHIPGARTLRVRLGEGGQERDTISVTGPEEFSLLSVLNSSQDGQQRFDLFFDSVWENFGNSGTGRVDANTVIGGRDDDGTSQRLNFDLAELVIFDRALSNAERLQIERYLTLKYALDTAVAPLRIISVSPAQGVSAVDPNDGIEVQVLVDVPGFEIDRVILNLNEQDRSSDVVVTRDGDQWTIRFDELVVNTEYSGFFTLITVNETQYHLDVNFDTVQPDPITFDPRTIPGVVFWLDGNDPSSMTLDDDGRVSVWTDKSSLAHEARRDIPAQQPVFMPGIVNGRGVVRFNGAQSLLLGQPPALDFEGTDDFTFFAVVNSRNNGSIFAKTTGGTMQYRFHIPGERTLRVRLGVGGQEQDTISVTGEDYFSLLSVLNSNQDGAQRYDLFFDGVWENSGNSGSSRVDANAVIGGRDDAGTAQRLNFDLAELILFDRALTEREKLEVEVYLSLKFGLEADISPIVIEHLFPADGQVFVDASQGIELQVQSVLPDSELQSIRFTLDGHDVTGDLIVTGNDIWTARFENILSDRQYHGVFLVETTDGHARAIPVRFDTFSLDNYTFEAEDYNFEAGQFIDDPPPSAFYDGQFINADVGYLDRRGQHEIDFFSTHPSAGDPTFVGTPEANYIYRLYDPISTRVVEDFLRQQYVDLGIPDHYMHGLGPGEWLNYSRTYPAGEFNLYARVTGSSPVLLRLDRVVSNPSLANQNTESLGIFSGPGPGADSFAFVPLLNPAGGLERVSFDGGVQTLRVTALSGGTSLNFFMFAPAAELEPVIGGLIPRDGERFYSAEGGVQFTAFADGGIASSAVVFMVNGVDRSIEVQFTSDGDFLTGRWDGLSPDESYVVEVRVLEGDVVLVERGWRFDTRVRPPFDPLALGGLVLWLDASDSASVVLDELNGVEQWLDKSGRENHASQPDSTRRPRFLAGEFSGLAGQPILRFDGVDDHLTLGDRPDLDLDPQQDFTFFALVHARNNGALFARTDGSAMQYRFHVPLEGHFRANIGHFVNVNTISTLEGEFGLLSSVSSQQAGVQTVDMYFNGRLEGSGATGATLVDGNTIIGARDPFGDNQPLDSDLPELFLFNRALSDAERRQVEEYLILKYLLDIEIGVPDITPPQLAGVHLADNELRFTFFGESGVEYRVETRATLWSEDDWIVISTIQGSNEMFSVAIPIEAAALSAFVRVVAN